MRRPHPKSNNYESNWKQKQKNRCSPREVRVTAFPEFQQQVFDVRGSFDIHMFRRFNREPMTINSSATKPTMASFLMGGQLNEPPMRLEVAHLLWAR
jgi:hypothetical protein